MTSRQESLVLALSRRFAQVEKRNVQSAIIATARALRAQTKDNESYEALGLFITATPFERNVILNTIEATV